MTDQPQTPRAGAFVAKKLHDLDAALAATSPRVLPSRAPTAEQAKRDDEAIHDLRVAIRRLRTLLKISRDLFGRWHTDVARRAFTDVMRATGELRDEEVLEETLSGLVSSPAYESWLADRAARERDLRAAVVDRLASGALERARGLLGALLAFPVDPTRDEELARFARKTVERARRQVEKRRDVPTDDVEAMHELRIAYKELRYAIELLREALPIDARAMLEPATVFQKRLGDIHDVDVAIEVIAAARTLPHDVREHAGSALRRLRAKRVAKYLRELDPLGIFPEVTMADPPAGPAPSPDGHTAASEPPPAGAPAALAAREGVPTSAKSSHPNTHGPHAEAAAPPGDASRPRVDARRPRGAARTDSGAAPSKPGSQAHAAGNAPSGGGAKAGSASSGSPSEARSRARTRAGARKAT